jgi:hypothetical protein
MSSTNKKYPRPEDIEKLRHDILLKRNAEIELTVDAIMEDIFRGWETTGCVYDISFSDQNSIMPRLEKRLKGLGWTWRHYEISRTLRGFKLEFFSVYTRAPGST